MQVTYKPYQDKYITTYYVDGHLALLQNAVSYAGFFASVIAPAFVSSLPYRMSRLWSRLSTEQAATIVILGIMLAVAIANKILA